MSWKEDLWRWLESSVAVPNSTLTFRLYWDRKKSVYANARLTGGQLRVDADEHLLGLLEEVPAEAFVAQQKDDRYRVAFQTSAARIRRAEGTTVMPVSAAHAVLLPLGAPKRTTVSCSVYRDLYIDGPNLWAPLHPTAAERIAAKVRSKELKRVFSQAELARALGFLVQDDEAEDEDEEEAPTGIPWEDHRNVIFFGPPGTGKSYELRSIVRDHLRAEPAQTYRVTFHPESSYYDFVGTYKPVVGWLKSLNEFTAADGTVHPREPRVYYDFDPGPLSLALVDALNHPDDRVVLVIEEINRGNCAAIFGDVFQLLDRVTDDDGPRSGSASTPSFRARSGAGGSGNTSPAPRSAGTVAGSGCRRTCTCTPP